MTWDDERRARAGLCAVCSPGDPWLRRALHDRSAVELWDVISHSREEDARTRRAHKLSVDRLMDTTEELGFEFLIPTDEQWPVSLGDLDLVDDHLGGPPVGLWTRGHADLANRVANCVAIVGSRAATSYGQDVASELAFDLARRSDIPDHTSWTIISGGAFGVDVAAHRGALAARGCTVSVQAGGLDQLYPRGNTAVLEQVACGGALVSEVPPGAHPTKPGFLARNRLIAAMSSGVVIVEAGIRSGALNTTMWANALMRPVMAIPGPVTSSMSAGTHRLIRDNQAVLVRDADDVSAQIGPLQPELPPVRSPQRQIDTLRSDLLAVHEALPASGGSWVDEIALDAGVAVSECLALLAELAELGMAQRGSDGTWSVVSPWQRGACGM